MYGSDRGYNSTCMEVCLSFFVHFRENLASNWLSSKFPLNNGFQISANNICKAVLRNSLVIYGLRLVTALGKYESNCIAEGDVWDCIAEGDC